MSIPAPVPSPAGQPVPAYESAGPWVPFTALRLIGYSAGGGAWKLRKKFPDAYAALQDAGLIDDKGLLTRAGTAFTAPARNGKVQIEVEGQHGSAGSAAAGLKFWSGPTGAMLAARRPLNRATRAPGPDGYQLDFIHNRDIAETIRGWVGLDISPSPTAAAEQVPFMLFDDRRNGTTTEPPAGLSPALSEVWAGPWTEWRIRIDAVDYEGMFVSSAAGHFTARYGPAYGQNAELELVSGDTLWRELTQAINRALGA